MDAGTLDDAGSDEGLCVSLPCTGEVSGGAAVWSYYLDVVAVRETLAVAEAKVFCY